MTPREELEKLRRLKELEAKASGVSFAEPDVTVTRIGDREITPEQNDSAPPVTDLRQVSRLAGIIPEAATGEAEPKKTFTELALEPITSYPEVYKRKVAENVGLAKEGAAQLVEDPTLLGKAAGLGKTALGGVLSVLSPAEAAIETLVAEPVEKASVGTIPKELTQTATELSLPFTAQAKLVKQGAKTIEDITKIDPTYASAAKQTERAAEAQTRAAAMDRKPTIEELKGGIAAKPSKLYQDYIGRPALEFAKRNPLSLATAAASASFGLDTLDEDASVSDQVMAAGLFALAGFGGAKGTKVIARNIPAVNDKNVAEWFSRGVIDNYGLPQDILDVKANAKMFNNQASDDFVDLVKDFRKLPENERKSLYYIMQGEEVPIKSLAGLGDKARETITKYGQKMVDVGLLSPETFNKNAATYLHREYTTKLKPPSLIERATQNLRLIGSELKPRGVVIDVAKEELPKFLEQGWELFGSSKSGKARIRRQLTKEERLAKGEIDDAAFAIARTGQLMSNDIATYKLFDDIAKMDQYVSDVPREGWEQVTTDKLKGTNIAKFGNLAGKYVDPTVLNDLKSIDSSRNLSRNPVFKTYQELLRAWKVGKTALNPAVHVNNIMSNFMLYDLSGSDWSSLARAANELRKGSDSELYEQARKLGVFDAGFAPQELSREGRKVLDEISTINPATDNVDKMFRVANAGWRKTGGKVIDAYQQEDSIFRFGIYIDRIRAGMSPEDAAKEAKKWLIDYEINAPIIQAMRNTTSPFIAYSYRAIPLLAESAALRPWKYAKWAALGHAINEYGEAEGAGDTELERKMMPEYQKGTWFGAPGLPPTMIKLPTKDRSEYIDVKRFVPGGDVFETTATKRGVPYLPQPLQPGGPILDSFTMLVEGRDPFTGRDLPGLGIGATEGEVRKNDLAIKGAAILSGLLPNLPGIPGSYATEKFKRAASESGGESPTRSAITMGDAILQSLGFKITPVDVDKLTLQQVYSMQRERTAIVQDFNRVRNRFEQGLATEEELLKASDKLTERIEKLGEKYQKRMEPKQQTEILKKAEGGPVYSMAEESLLKKYADGGMVTSPEPTRDRKDLNVFGRDTVSRFLKSYGTSLPGAAVNVGKGYWDILSAFNQYLYKLEPEQQVEMLKRLPAGLRDMVASGIESAKEIPSRVASATPEEAGRFSAQMTAEIALDPFRGRAKPVAAEVVKPKGGEFVQEGPGSPKEVAENLKSKTFGVENVNFKEMLNNLSAIEGLSPEKKAEYALSIKATERRRRGNVALNNWLDTKLTKYIRNEMATPEDPIRALAEQDILHVRPDELNFYIDYYGKNPVEGQSFLAKNPSAKTWEGASDLTLGWKKAGDVIKDVNSLKTNKGATTPYGDISTNDSKILEKNPWISQIDPEKNVYLLSEGPRAVSSSLGFTHLRDELRNSVRPDTDLPDQLKLTPEQLGRMSVPDAVRHVSKINKWREKKKAEANFALANNAATVPFKDYPDQKYGWFQLRSDNPESNKALADALKYEGDMMGHCVGGYCDSVISGESQIFSLRNKKTGEPHVTIEIEPGQWPVSGESFAALPQSTKAQYREIIRQWWKKHPEIKELSDDNTIQALKEAGISEPPAKISQIKGKANRAPNEEYIPFVQDFVKSGNWATVRDLENAKLYKVDPNSDIANALKSQNKPVPQYITDTELTKLSEELGRNVSIFGKDSVL